MRKSILRLTFCIAILFMSAAGGILWTHRAARLDLSNDDAFHTAGKFIGMIPASREIYAAGVGLVDQTLFYQAVVTPDEVAWLAQTPAVDRFAAPNHAPWWWSLSLWWHGKNSDMQYFRTKDKWPCLFAYSRQKGLVYGTVEFD